VLCATIQALSFTPLALLAVRGHAPSWVVYFAASVYWGAGLATSPAWNTWMERLVPRRIRVRYFARRTRLAHAFVLFGLLAGGLTLHALAPTAHRLTAFAGLFAVAAVARLVSAAFLSAQSEPTQPLDRPRLASARELLSQARHSANGRLVAYLLLLQAAAQLAGPYFTPFMLGQLQLSYSAYMTVLATSFLAKSLALPLLGRIASRIGAMRLLWIGGLAIAPLPALWVISHSVPYLLFLQILGGLAWGAHELAMFLLFFETIPEGERTGVLTTFNLTC
jgi:MFS family permease